MKLTTPLLLSAYAQGFFPMPEPETGEIEWFRPDPRAVFPLEEFHISHSLQKKIRRKQYSVTFNTHFVEVMKACAEREETWINEEFLSAYTQLHRKGYAHSVEIWKTKKLIGGVYGVSIGGAFFAESKFHRATDASKLALYHLIERLKERHFELLEVQFLTPHLESLGAIAIPDEEYQKRLAQAIRVKASFG